MGKGVVVVTGSSGLIGSRVVRALADRFTVVGFDRAGDPHPPIEAECVCVDLASDASVEAGLARVRYAYGEHITAVVHLAAYYDFSGARSPLYEEVTIDGTSRLLTGLQAFDVEQFVFSSTMLVHAPVVPGERITEDARVAPSWAYPASKVATEGVVSQRRGDIPAVLLRIAGVYDEMGHSPPLADQLRRIYEKRITSRFYPGSLQRGSSFVHLDDVVAAISACIERRRELPAEVPLLIGEEDTMGYGELQRELGRLLHGYAWRTYRIPKVAAKIGAWVQDRLPGADPFVKPWMAERADDHYALDTRRARTMLGWQPEHTLRQTLPALAAALHDEPEHWYDVNGFGEPPTPLPTGMEGAVNDGTG